MIIKWEWLPKDGHNNCTITSATIINNNICCVARKSSYSVASMMSQNLLIIHLLT